MHITGWTAGQNAPCARVLYRYWTIGLDPSTAATAIMDSHLHIARGPFFGHAREAGGLVVDVWSSKLKPSELGPKAMNCTFWLLLPAPCATPLSVPVKRHRALHLQH